MITQTQLNHYRATATKERRSAYHMAAFFAGVIKVEGIKPCKAKAKYWINTYRRLGGLKTHIDTLTQATKNCRDTIGAKKQDGVYKHKTRDINNLYKHIPSNEQKVVGMDNQQLDELFNQQETSNDKQF